MTDSAVPTTPPGWYDDGTGTRNLRWWDGNVWTENTAPMQDPSVPPVKTEATPGHGGPSAATPEASEPPEEENDADDDQEAAEPTPEGALRATTRNDSVTLQGDAVTIVFGNFSSPTPLKQASPRYLPLESIRQIFYTPAGQWKIGSLRFEIVGDTRPIGKPGLDINTVLIAAGRGKKMRDQWDTLVAALRPAISAAAPKVPLTGMHPAAMQEKALITTPSPTSPKDVKARAKEVAKLNKTYPARRTEWQVKVSQMESVIQIARDARPDTTTTDIVLKAGEQHWLTMTGGLVDEVAATRTWVSGSRGVSVPIGKIGGSSIRYYAGSSKGHSVQAPPHDAIIDSGRIVITDQRVVFVGMKQTRECRFSRMVSYDHAGVGNTVISVSNRQKPTRLHYDDSNIFQIYFEFAIAAFKGETPDVVEQLQGAIDTLRQQEPRLLEA